MRLSVYLSSLYALFFVSISSGLALLINVVELIEKLLHSTPVPLSSLLRFITLNLAPAWLSLLPIASWLAMIATIYHLASRREWHTCTIMGITWDRIMLPFVWTLLGIMLSTLVAKHLFLDQLSWQARTEYQRLFSQKKAATITNQWCHLDEGRICTVGTFDQRTNQGTDLYLYTYTTTAVLHSVTHAPTFTHVGTLFYAPSADEWHAQSGLHTIHRPLTLRLPSLAQVLTEEQPPVSLLDMLLLWWHTPRTDQLPRLRHEIYRDLAPLFSGLLIALLTLFLFICCINTLFITLCAYPAALFVHGVMTTLMPPHPLSLPLALLLLIGASFALAKAKNSRILRAIT